MLTRMKIYEKIMQFRTQEMKLLLPITENLSTLEKALTESLNNPTKLIRITLRHLQAIIIMPITQIIQITRTI
jgi:hypothetical protein